MPTNKNALVRYRILDRLLSDHHHYYDIHDLRKKVNDKLDYMSDPTLLGTLFDNISNEVVIRLSYHTFTDPTVRSIDFHPYLLWQYNDRWFLIGADDRDMAFLNFALGRIDKAEPLPEKKYVEY